MPSSTSPVGKSGLPVFSGRIFADFLVEMRGLAAYKRFDEMRRNSSTIGAALYGLDIAVRGAIEWRFESDEGEDDERLALIDRAMVNLRMSLADHISEAMTMTWAGYAPFAIWYERVGGEILWKKFLLMGQDTIYRWYFDEDGGLEGLDQQAPPEYSIEYVPIERMILYRTKNERNNPEGYSLLRNSWIDYYFAKNIKQIEGIGIERDLAGMPKVKLPASADTSENSTDMQKAELIVRNIRNDEQSGIVEPAGWEVTLMTSGGTRLFDTDKIINRYEQRALMSMMAQVFMLGQEGVGSFALSDNQGDFLTMSVNTIADVIAETFTKFAIPRLLKLNGYEADGIRLVHTPANKVEMEKLGSFLSGIAGKGYLTWTSMDEEWLRDSLHLPDMSAEDIEAEKVKQKAEQQEAMKQMAATKAVGGNAPFGNQDSADADLGQMRAQVSRAAKEFYALTQNQPVK